MSAEESWRTWWEAEGKHMERLPHHNAMDHIASVTRIAWLNGAFAAADEIERLRVERDEARRELDRLGPLLLHAASEIKKVCAERDEARREVCNLSIHPPRDYALERGWFCFKEQK